MTILVQLIGVDFRQDFRHFSI